VTGQLIESLLYQSPLYVAVVFITVFVVGSFSIGFALHRQVQKAAEASGATLDNEGAVEIVLMALLSLLIGFAFAAAENHYQSRRVLVIDEAGAVNATYFWSQTIEGQDRQTIRELLRTFVATQLAAYQTADPRQAQRLMVQSQALLDKLSRVALADLRSGSGASAAKTSESVQQLERLVQQRRELQRVHIPSNAYLYLLVNAFAVAAGAGHAWVRPKQHVMAVFLLLMIISSFLMVIDIDRPIGGANPIAQQPMADVYSRLTADPLAPATRSNDLAVDNLLPLGPRRPR
jgi:hypothetical protein